jgi:hypothetical protein
MPDMSKEWHEESWRLRNKWFLGNQEAIAFISVFFDAVELWDDLIDKDVEISDDHINRAFVGLMFVLPANDWFVAHRGHYLPLILMAINAWFDANELAKSERQSLRNVAFHLRNAGIEIHLATAFLVGGWEHMRKVSKQIREFFAFEEFEG